jgi:hypothetical protein
MSADGAAALDALYWRDEILQALYWLEAEGLAEWVDGARLAELVVSGAAIVAAELERLAAGGYLDVRPGPPPCYRLTALGRREGARRFADEFEGFTRQAHGECAPGCWCQDLARAGDPCPSHQEAGHGI